MQSYIHYISDNLSRDILKHLEELDVNIRKTCENSNCTEESIKKLLNDLPEFNTAYLQQLKYTRQGVTFSKNKDDQISYASLSSICSQKQYAQNSSNDFLKTLLPQQVVSVNYLTPSGATGNTRGSKSLEYELLICVTYRGEA